MKIRNIGVHCLLLMFSFTFLNCTKEEIINNDGDTKLAKLVFNVSQIEDSKEQVIKFAGTSASINEPLASGISTVNSSAGFSTDASAEQTLIETSNSNQQTSSLNGVIKKIAATSPMKQGNTYRVMLYNDGGNNLLVKTVLVKSGDKFSIDVPKGGKFKWYAYSFNDELDIPEPSDLQNPQIESSVDRGLMYATGTVETLNTPVGQLNTYPINIVFNHKVAQAKMKIDATSLALVANIQQLKIEFLQDNHFKTGTFSIKGNTMSNIQVVPTKTVFSGLEASNIYEKSFYTVDASTLNQIQIDITQLTVNFFLARDGVGQVVDLINFNPNNKPKFVFNFTTPGIGQRLSANANLKYILQSRRIFHVANGTDFAYALQQGPGWEMIRDQRNFGNTPQSIVKMLPYNPQNPNLGPWIGGGLADNKATNWVIAGGALSTQNRIINELSDVNTRPDILIIGYNQTEFNTQCVTAIVNYVNAGGVLVWFNEFVDPGISSLLNQIFETTGMTTRAGTAAGAMYPLLVTPDNDRVLNGPFGDARGKLWGEDASVTHGVVGLDPDDAFIYSYGQAINRSFNQQDANMVTMFKHKVKNFFYLGDGGLVSYNGGNSPTICPFAFEPATGKPIPKLYGNAGNGYTSRSQLAWNSVIAGNVMLWAGAIAEFSGIRPWKYNVQP